MITIMRFVWFGLYRFYSFPLSKFVFIFEWWSVFFFFSLLILSCEYGAAYRIWNLTHFDIGSVYDSKCEVSQALAVFFFFFFLDKYSHPFASACLVHMHGCNTIAAREMQFSVTNPTKPIIFEFQIN